MKLNEWRWQTIAQHPYGSSTWIWFRYYNALFKLNELVTGHCIWKAYKNAPNFCLIRSQPLPQKCIHLFAKHVVIIWDTSRSVHCFKSGAHVIRQSEHNWSGLSTGLVIEQVLMRSLKSTGGLTRGRGLSESQRTKWLLSMPICLQMDSAMQEFSQTVYKTSERHRETTKSRVSRDSNLTTMMTFLYERNPFDSTETKLRNIESGVTADDSAVLIVPRPLEKL